MSDLLASNPTITTNQKKISFHFHPYKQSEGLFAIEKSLENGKKNRFLQGIASGPKKDLHGERITEKCIKSFINQANSGELLLFPDIHNIRQSEDIGRLIEASITEDGDWFTKWRLYDEDDDIGQYKLEKINTIWKQVNGLPPYEKKIQKGFSIEGYIPESTGIISMSSTGQRVIDEILLDGAILVPRPAYQTSIANAVFKALGELPPWEKDKIKKSIDSKLSTILQNNQMQDQYYSKKYEIDDAFQDLIEEIMNDPKPNKKERLESLFDEYKLMMINLIMTSSGLFSKGEEMFETLQKASGGIGIKILKDLESNLQKLAAIRQRRIKNGD